MAIVSVCLITYNHEAYIAQALTSVVTQKVNFPMEIIVYDDASTDRTAKIIKQFLTKSPFPLTVKVNHHNLGMGTNFRQALCKCRGRYLAILEGDDYWTDKQKLLSQVNYLEKTPSLSGCFHRTQAIFSDHSRPSYNIPGDQFYQNTLTTKDLLKANSIATCSVMYRRSAIQLPSWVYNQGMIDWPMHLLASTAGDIGFIPKTMAVYRRHQTNSFAGRKRSQNYHDIIKVYWALKKHFGPQYQKLINQRLVGSYLDLIKSSLKEKCHLINPVI